MRVDHRRGLLCKWQVLRLGLPRLTESPHGLGGGINDELLWQKHFRCHVPEFICGELGHLFTFTSTQFVDHDARNDGLGDIA